MTQIDFYILSDKHLRSVLSSNGKPDSRLPFACRLIEKIHKLNKNIYIHSNSPTQADEISKSLWQEHKESFLAHEIRNEENKTSKAPIEIGHQLKPATHDVMINLSNEIPSFVGQFDRVVELASDDEKTRETARERYIFYKKRGYPLKTHDLNKQ